MLGNIIVVLILAVWAIWSLKVIIGEAKHGGCVGCSGSGCGGGSCSACSSGSALEDLNKLADRLAAERRSRENR